MVVKIGDINVWISRYYSGDMTAYVFMIIALIILGVVLQFKVGDKNFNKIFIFASVCWFVLELVLQLTGMRAWYSPPTIFGYPIDVPWTAFLQGPVEGGMPTTLGYLCAKVFYEKKYYWFLACMGMSIFFSFLFIFGFDFAAMSPLTVSHRVLSIWGIVFIVSTTILALILSVRYFEDRKFPYLVFIFMAILGVMINIVMYFAGLRNIEYAIPFNYGETPTIFFPYPFGIALLVLLYDGIFEFAGIYLFIFIVGVKLFNMDILEKK
ncbi:MAG: hypothetical protein ACTSYB_06420 [Candidatus Helarchaeota archaeon]